MHGENLKLNGVVLKNEAVNCISFTWACKNIRQSSFLSGKNRLLQMELCRRVFH